MYDDNYELEECMEFFMGLLFALLVLAIIVLAFVITFVYVNWLLLVMLVIACIGLLRVIKHSV
jgi:hypothetical protein